MHIKVRNYQEWVKTRYALFNTKINSFADHPKNSWLRQYADEAIQWNENFGILQIKAEDFIDRIETMPLDYIRDWLDGKNQLERVPGL